MNTIDLQRSGDLRALLRQPAVFVLVISPIPIAYGLLLAAGVSPLLLLLLPLGLIFVALAFLRPDLVGVALLAITWGYISEIAIRYHGVPSITKTLVLVLTVALGVRYLAGWRPRVPADRLNWLMVGYLVVVFLGFWYAPYPERVELLFVDFAKDLVLYFLLIILLANASTFERGIWGLLAIGALLGTAAAFQEITQSYDSNLGGLARIAVGQIAEGFANRPRAGGPMNDPNAFGQQLVFLVPLGLWAAVYGRTLLYRFAGIYTTVVCLIGIGLSFSRGSYLALGLVLVLYAWHIRLNPRYLLVLVPVAALLFWTTPSEVTARFETLGVFLPGNEGVRSEASLQRRSVEMKMAAYMFADHPVLGVGGFNYRKLYPEYIREAGSPVPAEERDTHSFYLEIAAEHGLVGVAIVGSILVLVWRRLRQAQALFAQASAKRMMELSVALQIGFAGYLVSATFLHGIYSRFLWLQVAIAAALFAIAGEWHTSSATSAASAGSSATDSVDT